VNPNLPGAVPAGLVATARESYQRCCQSPGFPECFYRNLFMVAPHVETRFANTDFERQHRLLQHAIGLLLSFPTQPATEPTILRRVADRHKAADLDVPPDWYADFVEALIQTVSERDDQHSDDVTAAWRATVAPGIEYMKAQY
jgi:hemoglobin-like flavoprotein